MGFYKVNLLVCVLFNGLCMLLYSRVRRESEQGQRARGIAGTSTRARKFTALKSRYLPVYLLINGADWLQVADSQKNIHS